MRLLNKKIESAGFSLVEVLAALGIVSVISLMVGSMMNTNKRYSRNLQSYDEIGDFINEMYHQAQILDVCNVNFPAGTSIPLASDRTTFLDGNGATLFSSGDLGTNKTISAFSYNIDYKNSAIKDQVMLTVTFTTGNDVSGSNTVSRGFPLYVSFDTATDTITGCVSMDDNYNSTILEQSCQGTGAVLDSANESCYHIGLQTTDCSTDQYVSGFYFSSSDRLYKFYPSMCLDMTGLLPQIECVDQLLMGFDGSGNFTCLDLTSDQFYPGFDQTAEACGGSTLTLNKNSPTGPVDVDCSGAAVPTPTPTSSSCTMAANSYLGSHPPLSLWGDGNWNTSSTSNGPGAGFLQIIPLGSPYAPYLFHQNDVTGYAWEAGTTGDMLYNMIYSFNFYTANPPSVTAFEIEDITSGNNYKVTYYTRAVSSQSTDPSSDSTAYGSITCKYTFEKTAATTYQYTMELESCDPASGTNPTDSAGPTSFTYSPGAYSINLGNRFIDGLAPACGISIVGPGCTRSPDDWGEDCSYSWTWITASQANSSFSAPNIWQKQLEVIGGDYDTSNPTASQTKGVLDNFIICSDTNAATGASSMCGMP